MPIDTKVLAGAIVGAVMAVGLWVAEVLGAPAMPAQVQAALQTGLVLVAQWLIANRTVHIRRGR